MVLGLVILLAHLIFYQYFSIFFSVSFTSFSPILVQDEALAGLAISLPSFSTATRLPIHSSALCKYLLDLGANGKNMGNVGFCIPVHIRSA